MDVNELANKADELADEDNLMILCEKHQKKLHGIDKKKSDYR